MFDVFQPVLAMILVSLSAVFGAVISFFTKLEMESYQNVLERTRNVLGILLFLAVLVGGVIIKCPITVVLAVAAMIAFVVFRKKSPFFRWAILGAVLGFLFARDINTAYMASIFFAVHNFVYATVLNVPHVLKKKKFMKTRLTEQAVFLVCAVIAYFLVNLFF